MKRNMKGPLQIPLKAGGPQCATCHITKSGFDPIAVTAEADSFGISFLRAAR